MNNIEMFLVLVAISAFIIVITFLVIVNAFVCFNDLNDYFEYRLKYGNDTNVAFPCPDLDISKLPKDESNK